MSGAMYSTTVAIQRKHSLDRFLDGDKDANHMPAEQWEHSDDDDFAEPPCFDEPETDAADAVAAVVDTHDAEDHSLGAMYARMPGDRTQTVLFDLHSSATPTDKHEAELCRELGAAFSRCLGYQDGHDVRASHELRQLIAYNSNYQVEQVVRVMNRKHFKMQQAFAENYAIDVPRKVFHGTSEDGARLITAVGFKGAACRRALFGKGIYTSPVVWEALAYAKPDANMKQVLVVVELLQGPTAFGSQDQVDFGVDNHGSEILTLTNHDETILCASKENQMLATHHITLRYMTENSFALRHRECVRIVHADVATKIKQILFEGTTFQSLANPALPPSFFAATSVIAPPAPVVRGAQSRIPAAKAMLAAQHAKTQAELAAARARKNSYTDAPHHRYSVGDKVIVNNTLKAYSDFKGMRGVVCRIVKAHSYLICVRPDSVYQRFAVAHLNKHLANKDRCSFLKPDEDDLLLLTIGQVHIIRADKPAQHDTVLGKRQADADP